MVTTTRSHQSSSLLGSLFLLCLCLVISPLTLSSNSMVSAVRWSEHSSYPKHLQEQHLQEPNLKANWTGPPHQYATPGLTASIGSSKFDQFKDVYFDFILYTVMQTNFTYLDFGHNLGFMKDNLFTLVARGEDATFELIPENDKLKVRSTGIKVELTSEYTRVREFILTASGHVHVVCQNITIEIEMNMVNVPSNDTNMTGRWLWGFETVDVLVEADMSQVELTMEGNILIDFFNTFSSLYLPMIVTTTENTMMLSLTESLPAILNYYPASIDGYLQAFDKSEPKLQRLIMDMDTSLPFNITDDYVGLSARGLWFHEWQGRRNITQQQELVMPYNDPTVLKPLQIFLGQYFFNSVAQTYTEANPGWGINITDYTIGNNSVVTLNTHFMNVYFPGMRKHFDQLITDANKTDFDPHGKEIRVFFELLNVTNWDSSAANQSMTLTLDWMLHFNVSMDNDTLGHNEVVALQLLMQNMEVEFIFDVNKPMTFRTQVKRMQIGSFTTVYSAFGPVNDRLYLLAINQLFFPETGMIWMFNTDVMNLIQIIIPSYLVTMVQLTDVQFYYYDHYIMFGSGLNFLPLDQPFEIPV